MTTITIECDEAGIEAAIASAIGDALRAIEDTDYQSLLQAEAKELEKLHKGYFDSETAWDGQKWKPLAKSTIERKGHNRILVDTTRLRQSLTQASQGIRDIGDTGTTAFLVFGTDVPYAATHQYGSGKVPARPPVGIADDKIDAMVDRIADGIIKQFEKGN